MQDIRPILLEYKSGMRRLNAKYIQRFGTPGDYRYIYKSAKYNAMSRKTRAVFGRIVHKANRFLKAIKLRYGATKVIVKPMGWHHAVVTLTGDKGVATLSADLVRHKTKGYRTKVQHRIGKLSTVSGNLKKKGILRYR
jgi:hypothetical protein